MLFHTQFFFIKLETVKLGATFNIIDYFDHLLVILFFQKSESTSLCLFSVRSEFFSLNYSKSNIYGFIGKHFF